MKLKEYRHQLEKSKEYTKAKEELNLHFALADAVLKARMNKGWTQKELAKAIGTKQANISRIESGLANPTLEFISRLTTVLDFDIAFIGENEAVIQFDYEHEELFLREFNKRGFDERQSLIERLEELRQTNDLQKKSEKLTVT